MTDKEKILNLIKERKSTIAAFNDDADSSFVVKVLERLIEDIEKL